MAVDLPDPPAPGEYEQVAEWMRAVRDAQVSRTPDEGLREHKKRLMRQQISDTATWMFIRDGFDRVRVADIAAAVGVSEKTVYNYFPTKESLVFDREADFSAAISAALRDRDQGASPVRAIVQVMTAEYDRFGAVPPEALWMMQAFDDMETSTPALVAARRAMTKRLIAVTADALAERGGLDPRDPEVQIVAHALLGLWETGEASMSRHIHDGLTDAALMAAVRADLDRAARLLETGFWAFDLVGQTRRSKDQLEDMLRGLDGARRQIAAAMREARRAAVGRRR